ncbi:response regulator transcription factor [Nocardia sp. CDC153]|uniref:response regulator transcription factor n=1 Tax=Nocardia sp. CDC153 TaxID=3112167 RepID=UPI002DB64B57|nr:response regulator transcription factor [Nocardia sp. CDC153]MEC3953690.1 response regulator transcription factor [Nocardia sp. CDC153]
MTTVASILLVEDDPAIREGLGMALRRQGHTVRTAATGEEGVELSRSGDTDLVVLDVMLPGIDGFEVCRRLRAESAVAIIMVTARDDDIDIVSGLEAGADDYVVKPVLPRVLDARIKAVLRRRTTEPPRVDRFGALSIDRQAMTVTKHDAPIALTPTEMRLLLELTAAPGQVLSRQQLLEKVWEHDYLGDSRLVDNGIQRLRAKVEDDSALPRYIQTVRGFGYRFGPV